MSAYGFLCVLTGEIRDWDNSSSYVEQVLVSKVREYFGTVCFCVTSLLYHVILSFATVYFLLEMFAA